MRYEDASHTAFQGNEPIARDDSDALPAGTRGPATGNLISGEGTQTGSSGADQAAGAHITSIAGKGGEDSSFSGGKLSVTGEFGKLSVDADGNYSYMANGGVENVRDRFVYTLADNQGNSDTAALIVEIGKTPVVIKAGAQQIVPGPDGVVTLPPGVQLSDVMVVGRNLVVNLPDGTQLVIIDGAIFVPQLVLDGVEVPATNLAALLIGQEPQPAAGEGPPQSSGGNFDVPVPPLDPGVPLGDLIPPTEYNYTPPEPEEVFDILDREPEAGAASAQLDDDAQAGGIAGGVGDDPGGNTAEGSLPGSGGDGDLEWALLASGELPVGFSFAAQPNGDVWIMQGGTHVLTVSVDPSNGDYTVTQVAPIDHPPGGDENNLDFVIEYSVTDDDGDTAIGSLTINVDDDTPTVDVTAGSDANVLLTTQDAQTDGDPTATDTATTAAHFGGVFGVSSAYGADGAGSVTTSYALSTTGGASGLSSHGAAINLYLIGGVVVGSTAASAAAVNAGNTIFDVSVDANGVVTLNQYQQIDHTNTDPSPTGPGYEDQLISLADGAITLTRTGSITDGDGDTVTDSASVGIGANIQFADDGPTIRPTLNEVGAAVVDESAPVDAATIPLVGGFTAGDDPHLSGGLAIGKGSTSGPVIDANAAFGADGPANGGGISYQLDVLNAASGLTTTDGTAINLVELSNGVVVGVVDGTSTVAFAIQINAGTGVVTVEQYLSIRHPDSPDNFDEPVFLNEGSLGVTVTASDFDGDSVTSDAVDITSLIRFEDDGPSINPALNANATVTVDESLPSNEPGIDTGDIVKGNDPHLDGGIAIGQANSGSAIVNANAVFGADGPAAQGSISYALSITSTNPGVTLTDGTPIELQMVNGVIVGVVDGGALDGQAAFAIAIDPTTGVVTVEQYLSLDHGVNPDPNDPLGLGEDTVAVTVTATDGDGDQVTSDDIDISGQITFLDDGPTVSPTLNAQATVTVDESAPSNDPGIDTGDIVKGDDPHLDGGIAIGQSNSGGAIVNANAVFGADGPDANGGLSYALVLGASDTPLTLTDGSTITLQLVGGVVVGVVDNGPFAGQAAFAIAINSSTGVVTVEQYLSVDHPANPNPNDALGLGPNTVGVTVTATDGDGDPVTSGAVDISNNISFLDDGPTIDPVLDREATVAVDESLPSGEPGINTGGITKGDDPHLEGGIAIGQGNSGTAIVDANAVFGADGPAAGGGISYQLVLGANDTPLTLTDGSTITLQLVGGVVVGVVDNGPFAGQAAFAIAINPTTGVVTVEQYLSLDHPVNPNPNDALGLGPNTVGVTVTATDGDGDPVTSGAVDISNNISFLDDGPEIDPVVNANATVTVDESLPSSDAGINTGGITKGNDPDLADGDGIAIGQANSGSAIVDANAVFGADGPAAGGGISYALSILNANSGLTLTDGTPINLQMVGGVIVGVVSGGAFNGQAAFAIAINSSTGVVTVEQYLSLDHPSNPNPNDPLSFGEDVIGVTVTATDGDGDPVTSGAVDVGGQITFLDDGPTANDDSDTVDNITDTAVGNVISGSGTTEGTGNADVAGADGFGSITGLVSDGTGDSDTNSAGGFTVDGQYGTLQMDANGQYTYTRDPGSPGNVSESFTYTYVDGDGDPVEAVLTISIADDVPTLPNEPTVNLDDDVVPGLNGNPDGTGDDDPDVVGDNDFSGQLVGVGGDGDLDYFFSATQPGLPAGFTVDPASTATHMIILQNGNPVLTIDLNNESGAYTVTQTAAITHPAGGAENNIPNITVSFFAQDVDGSQSAPGTMTINVDDDTPTIDVTAGSDANVTLTTDDPQTIAGATDNASTSANFGGVFGLTQSAGADGTNAAATLSFTLDVTGFTGPGGVDSGLDQGGNNIYLYEIGGKVVGSTSATQAGVTGSNTVFDVSVSGTGVVTLTQYSQIDHPSASDPSGTGAPFADHVVSLTDNLVTLTASSSITDKDGDTATDSATVNIGANLRFTDDGPDVAATLTGTQIRIDETDGVPAAGGEVDPVGGNLGTVTMNLASLVNVTQPHASADAPTTLAYSLVLSSQGVNSGLMVSSNNAPIFLYNIGGQVVGSTSATQAGVNGGNTAFTVSVDANTGAVTMTQFLAIEHSNTASNDEDSSAIAVGALNLRVTATDFDGDTDTAQVDLGSVIRFEDDGPTLGVIQDGTASNDPTDPVTVGTLHFAVGSDSPADVTNITTGSLAGITSGGKALVTNFDNATNTLTAYQDANGNGVYDAGTDTSAVFTLSVDPAAGTSGQYTFDLLAPLDPTITDVPIGGSSSFGAGPTGFQVLEDVGGQDLSVVTGYKVTGSFNEATWLSSGNLTSAMITAAGVNGSTTGWGVDNNGFEGSNELLFFDFGAQPLSDPDGPGGNDPNSSGAVLPNISTATFDFIQYTAADDITYVVHYTDGTFDSGHVPALNMGAGGPNWVFTADAGKFIADIQLFTSGTGPGKVDLVSVGVQSSDLDKTIDFTVTIKDADGDPVSGGFSVNVSDGNTNSTPEALVQQQSLSAESSSQSLLADDSGDQQTQKQAANSNTTTMAAAVAAAGMAESAAAAPEDDQSAMQFDQAIDGNTGSTGTEQQSVEGGGNASSFAAPPEAEEADDAGDKSSGNGHGNANGHDAKLDDSASHQSASDESWTQAADDQGPADSGETAVAPAPAVAMVSAEALKAADLEGKGEEGGTDGGDTVSPVEQILAEALGHGAAPTVDELLAGLPDGTVGALHDLTSPAFDNAPAWDMGAHGGFANAADVMMKMGADMAHHDAVQPAVNG